MTTVTVEPTRLGVQCAACSAFRAEYRGITTPVEHDEAITFLTARFEAHRRDDCVAGKAIH